MRRLVAVSLAGLIAWVCVEPLAAYLKIGTRVGTRTVNLRWRDFPIRYFVTNRGVDGVTAAQFQSAVNRAFNTWHAVETAQTSSEFVGFTPAPPFDDDDMSVIGYLDRPGQNRTLAATTFLIDTVSGEIVESDIFFNTSFPWSTAESGVTGRYDVESIALHEIGHLLGLSHSALGETELVGSGRRVIAAEAVMFPIAFSPGNISDRALKADDIAGISDVYGTSAFSRASGSISGRVTKNGSGVQGAHIIAFNPRTGRLIGGFTQSADGNFVIASLDPGPHVLRVEPLDDGDVESFFDSSMTVDLDFGARFHDRVVTVPRGGDANGVELRVMPK
ncbi:MAG TPA: matrixin family metalloprotease [Vicinamibacterales bacterium]|nr:matrixin family metalloprotease [Vicinamibacterales bacterium]